MTVWLVRIWSCKNAVEKKHTFSWRGKNVQTRTKSGYCVNPPLVSQNYDYLPSSLSACKTKGMMDQKWKWIADSIDCTDDNPFSVENIKLHWLDMKFINEKKR